MREVIDALDPDYTDTPDSPRRAAFGYAPLEAGADPSVTIVTPFFNTRSTVFEATVRSVLWQSLQQWEWFVVDDGSTNKDSCDILARCEALDSRIRVLRHDSNRGVSAARNTGAQHARAPFIIFLDSDDLIEPTAAEKWLWFLTSHAEYSFADSYTVGFGAEQYLWRYGFDERTTFLEQNLIGGRCMIRREAWRAAGGFDEEMRQGLEDWDFWLRCAANGLWGGTVPEFLTWHRKAGRRTEQEHWPDWDEGPRQRALRERFRKRYPHLWNGGFPQPRVDRPPVEAELYSLPIRNPLVKDAPRLLMIAPWVTTGGADKFNLDLISQIGTRGWKTTVATTLHGEHSWMPQLTELTPDVFALSHFLEPKDYSRFLAYLIGSRHPDAILITHSRFAYESLSFLRRVAHGIPIVDYCHNVEPGWLDGGYPRLSVEAGDLLDLRIVSSGDLKTWLVARGLKPEQVEVVYTGVDAAPPSELTKSELKVPEDIPVILYACRICDQKQPPVFAKTMHELRARNYRFVALVAGDGPDLPWLRDYIKQNRLSSYVHFLGPQPNERVKQLMALADIFFLPSRHEGISLAIYEAMAAGTVVVGADVGGQRELVTDDCGALLGPGANEDDEVTRYTETIGILLADPERRYEMGKCGRRRITASFSLSNMGSRMVESLDRARELTAASPLRRPSAEEARAAALGAIRTVHLDIAWAAAQQTGHELSGFGVGARARIAALKTIAFIGRPVDRLATRLGFEWTLTLKEYVARILLPR